MGKESASALAVALAVAPPTWHSIKLSSRPKRAARSGEIPALALAVALVFAVAVAVAFTVALAFAVAVAVALALALALALAFLVVILSAAKNLLLARVASARSCLSHRNEKTLSS